MVFIPGVFIPSKKAQPCTQKQLFVEWLRSESRVMSDRVKLPRAARTEPRFIDTNPKRQTLEELKALAREMAVRTPPRFVRIPRERGGGKVPPMPPWSRCKLRIGGAGRSCRRRRVHRLRAEVSLADDEGQRTNCYCRDGKNPN